MEEISEKYRVLIVLIKEVGVLAVLCGLLLWFMGTTFDSFKRDMEWSQSRQIRNERAIMQKLGMPLVLEGDDNGKYEVRNTR